MLLQNILLVEDNPADAHLMMRALRGISEEIIHVQRLRDAIQVLRRFAQSDEHDIDIILLDLGLPDTVRVEGVRQLRRMAPHIPCIVLTGVREEEAGSAALQEGAEDFLSKGEVTPHQLARSIGYAIERNRRLQASREAEASLRRVVEAHPDAMLVVGSDDLIKLANPAAAALLGRSARQLVGNRPPFPLTEGTPTLLELPTIGDVRTVEIVAARTTWEGESAWLAAVRDVSYRKREERLRRQLHHAERLAVLGQFAAGVAHEVNNPATVLMTNLQLLRMELPSLKAALADDEELVGALRESEEMLAESLRSISRITDLTRALQGFVEASRSETEQVDLAELIQNTCSQSRHNIRAVARLEVDLGPLPTVSASRDALRQVLINLLNNATEAIPPGSPTENTVRVHARMLDNTITISIEDTGEGVAAVLRERIFEPFYSTRQPGKGAGIGLPLARDITRRHGGELLLASEPGQPTRFVVTLPADTQLLPRPPFTPERPTKRAGRVLLIDDEPMVRRTLSQQLCRSGLDTAMASNGADALTVLEQDTRFDVILCDMMMPVLDGRGFYEALTEKHPELTQRVLFYSGGTLTARLHEFHAIVDRPVLRKPLSRLKLLNAVQELIRKDSAGG